MDLLLNSSGDLVFDNTKPTVTDPTNDLVQRLTITLKTFYGEWFLDVTLGINYFGQVFGKGKLQSAVDAIFQTQILADSEVASILSYTSTLVNNKYSCSFVVQAVNGSPVSVVIGA